MGYIHFENIHKTFGHNHVLKGITLDVEKGHLVTLLGPSGCGKSTLLRCLAGLEEVTSGTVSLDGKDITHVNPRDRGIGMVFQQYSLFPNMSVSQNVAFGLNMKKVDKETTARKVREMLAIVGLEDKADQYPSQLSGGQQQRVAIGRALMNAPQVMLADEPTGSLDSRNGHEIIKLLKKSNREYGQTLILVTHDNNIALQADRIIRISDGKVTQDERQNGQVSRISEGRTNQAERQNGQISRISEGRAAQAERKVSRQ